MMLLYISILEFDCEMGYFTAAICMYEGPNYAWYAQYLPGGFHGGMLIVGRDCSSLYLGSSFYKLPFFKLLVTHFSRLFSEDFFPSLFFLLEGMGVESCMGGFRVSFLIVITIAYT